MICVENCRLLPLLSYLVNFFKECFSSFIKKNSVSDLQRWQSRYKVQYPKGYKRQWRDRFGLDRVDFGSRVEVSPALQAVFLGQGYGIWIQRNFNHLGCTALKIHKKEKFYLGLLSALLTHLQHRQVPGEFMKDYSGKTSPHVLSS